MSSSDNAPHSRRAKILLLAYACDPHRGSEPGVGWNRAVQTARQHDTWLICERREFADSIRNHLAERGPISGLKFVFVPRCSWEHLLHWIPGMNYVAYNIWHRRAFRVAEKLHREVGFDLVHQLNICGFREPGYAWKLGIPLVWGPLGGTQNFPWRFLRQAGLKTALYETLRSTVNTLQLLFSPRVRRAAREAKVLLAANSTNQQDFVQAQGIEPRVLVETGINAVLATDAHPPRGDDEPLRILWSGLLIPRKAAKLLIEAVARLPKNVRYEVRIMGDGPLKDSLMHLAKRLGVDEHINWLGWIPHAEAIQQYAWADVFTFTSLRDTTGTVILEALGAGLPVMGLDHQGIRDIVTPECGVKIPVTTPDEVVQRIADSLASLAADPRRRAALSRGALERAHDYLWSRLGEQMAAVYREVLEAPQESNAPVKGRFDFSQRKPCAVPESSSPSTTTAGSAADRVDLGAVV